MEDKSGEDGRSNLINEELKQKERKRKMKRKSIC